MKIEVTKEDIDMGTRWDYNFCPIALAITRALQVGVYVANATVFCSGIALYRLPEVAIRFIEDFDCDGHRAVKPFTFELDMKV